MKALNVDTLGQTKNSGTTSREKSISSSQEVAVRKSGHLFHFDKNNGTGCVELRVNTYMLHGDIKPEGQHDGHADYECCHQRAQAMGQQVSQAGKQAVQLPPAPGTQSPLDV